MRKYDVVMSYEEWLKTDRGLVNERGEIVDPDYTSYTAYGRHIMFVCSKCQKGDASPGNYYQYATPWGFYQHLMGHNEVKQ